MEKRSLSDKYFQENKPVSPQAEAFRLQEAILLATDLAIFSTTPEGLITSFNRSAENLLGYPSQDAMGKAISSIFSEPAQAEKRTEATTKDPGKKTTTGLATLITRASAERKTVRYECNLVRKNGTYFPATISIIPLYDDRKNITGYAGTFTVITDITKQLKIMHSEGERQNIADENLRFFNNSVNLNAITDYDAVLKRISPSWTQLLGWTEQELKSKPFLHFMHPEDVSSTNEIILSLTEGKKVLTFENRIVSKDGSYHWLLWGAASDPKSRVIYASAINITERKKSEENILDSKINLETITHNLQKQNRQLDEFVHIISHNLRAPVNNIQALINLLNDKSAISDYKLIFDKLKNVAKNLSETMNELMDTLKVKTQPSADFTEIRFKELLDKVVQSLEGELIVAEASVTFDFNQAPAIHYSKPYLESIFQNLLTNAVKYRSPARNPKIHFQSSVVKEHIELKVIDNGQGIDMERFGDKLFGLHKTFHDHQEARGVGLFLIKTQIEAMGGKITVESEVDKGTTFTILFGN